MFNRNVWVHAFHEPDPKGLIDLGLPVDHIMFGSDFPHPEGMEDPLAYSEVVADLTPGAAGPHHGRRARAMKAACKRRSVQRGVNSRCSSLRPRSM